jgi:hypothetical protein
LASTHKAAECAWHQSQAASIPDPSSPGSAALPWQSRADASFVGRQAELQHLQAAFEAAAGGQGALMLLVGEPGIGKTAKGR